MKGTIFKLKNELKSVVKELKTQKVDYNESAAERKLTMAIDREKKVHSRTETTKMQNLLTDRTDRSLTAVEEGSLRLTTDHSVIPS